VFKWQLIHFFQVQRRCR